MQERGYLRVPPEERDLAKSIKGWKLYRDQDFGPPVGDHARVSPAFGSCLDSGQLLSTRWVDRSPSRLRHRRALRSALERVVRMASRNRVEIVGRRAR
jgi:hypothetical protein